MAEIEDQPLARFGQVFPLNINQEIFRLSEAVLNFLWDRNQWYAWNEALGTHFDEYEGCYVSSQQMKRMASEISGFVGDASASVASELVEFVSLLKHEAELNHTVWITI